MNLLGPKLTHRLADAPQNEARRKLRNTKNNDGKGSILAEATCEQKAVMTDEVSSLFDNGK
jgi:hypothetical protein